MLEPGGRIAKAETVAPPTKNVLQKMAISLGLKQIGTDLAFEVGNDKNKATLSFIPNEADPLKRSGLVEVKSPLLTREPSFLGLTNADRVRKMFGVLNKRARKTSYAKVRRSGIGLLGGQFESAVVLDPRTSVRADVAILVSGEADVIQDSSLVISPDKDEKGQDVWRYFVVKTEAIKGKIEGTNPEMPSAFYRSSNP